MTSFRAVCSDEELTLETSAKHHTPQAKNIPYAYQPLLIKPTFSVLAHADKTVFSKLVFKCLNMLSNQGYCFQGVQTIWCDNELLDEISLWEMIEMQKRADCISSTKQKRFKQKNQKSFQNLKS